MVQNLDAGKKQAYKEKVETYSRRDTDMNRDNTDAESRGWDLKFQNYWSHISTSQGHYNKNVEISERLIDHVGKFRETAEMVVVGIINELHKPER